MIFLRIECARQGLSVYLDKYFTGWLDPTKLKLLDYAVLAELLIAYIDDAHAAGETGALEILDRRAKAD